ncbi:MAG: M23 family metallopeptidase [Caldilineaceae bacterium]|nr:M23 family metallopeptidase [Caldilineaceae bacterium]
MITKAMRFIIILTLIFVNCATTAIAQSSPAGTEISEWIWPVDISFYLHEHAVDGTTIENVNFGVRNLDLTYPSPNRLGCLGVGWFKQYHAGIDIYNRYGTMEGVAVHSIADGVVIHAGGNYPGMVVIVKHDISGEPTVYSVYMHLDSVPDRLLGASPGSGVSVAKGEMLGRVLTGNDQDYDGRFPAELHPDGDLDDSHLHFEIQTFGLDKPYGDPDHPCSIALPAGLGYTYPELPEDMGYIDPIQFLSERTGTNPFVRTAYSRFIYFALINGGSITPPPTCSEGTNLIEMNTLDGNGPPYRPWFEISSAYGTIRNDGSELAYYPFIATSHPGIDSPVWSSPQAAMFNVSLETSDSVTQRDEEFIQSFATPSGAASVSINLRFKFNGTTFGVDPDDRILFELTDAKTGRPVWSTEIEKNAFDTDTWFDFNQSSIGVSGGQQYSIRMSLLTNNSDEMFNFRETYVAIDNVNVIVQCE